MSQPLLDSLHSICLRGEIAKCWSTAAVWVNVFSAQVWKPWAQTCAEDPAGALGDYAAFLIFLAATNTRARHFSAAFIFKYKTCNGRH